MDTKTYIKNLCSNNIYINNFKVKKESNKKYAVFTMPSTAFKNHPELLPTAVFNDKRDIGCGLKANQTRKDYFCISPKTKDMYIGKRTEFDFWALYVDISNFNLTYANHKLSWTPLNSSYEGSVSIKSFGETEATSIYGSQLYCYADCQVINGLSTTTKANWCINAYNSTVIRYLYLVNETINICNIFKRTIDNLIKKSFTIYFHKNISALNYSYLCICGYSNNRKHFLERYSNSLGSVSGSNIKDYSTIDISKAFDSLFTSDIAKEFNYTKAKFKQDFDSSTSSNFVKLYNMFYKYCDKTYTNKYFTITRYGNSSHKPRAVVTKPDGSTTKLTSITVKGKKYTIYTTHSNKYDREILLGLYKKYVDGTYTNIKIEFVQ